MSAYGKALSPDNSNITSREALRVTCAETDKNICNCHKEVIEVTDQPVTVTTFVLSVPEGGKCILRIDILYIYCNKHSYII